MTVISEAKKLNWEKVNGLMPAIVQDNRTLQVLMLGYMNKEALDITCNTGKVTFYSRTKQRLWTKGETSGNELQVVHIVTDCDHDTLLVLVNPTGLACHLGTKSCFGFGEGLGFGILAKLDTIVEQRYKERKQNSYTSKLFDEGTPRIAQKVGEEGVEVALASVTGTKEELIGESADLIFHLMVLLRQCDIDLLDVLVELNNRTQKQNYHP